MHQLDVTYKYLKQGLYPHITFQRFIYSFIKSFHLMLEI